MMLGPVTVALGLLALLPTISMAAPVPQALTADLLNGTSLTVAPLVNATASAVNSTISNASSVSPPSSSSPKLVVAHFMVGNSYVSLCPILLPLKLGRLVSASQDGRQGLRSYADRAAHWARL